MRDLARSLRAEVARAAAAFRTWGEAEAMAPRGTDKWVRKEILGHLIDSAVNNHQRFVRAQLADPYVGPGYEQQAWVSVNRYRERPWTELVDLWVGLNGHVATVIEYVPPDRLKTVCRIGEYEPASLEFVMTDYLTHLKHHLAQIEER
jgi:hypothetical protein